VDEGPTTLSVSRTFQLAMDRHLRVTAHLHATGTTFHLTACDGKVHSVWGLILRRQAGGTLSELALGWDVSLGSFASLAMLTLARGDREA